MKIWIDSTKQGKNKNSIEIACIAKRLPSFYYYISNSVEIWIELKKKKRLESVEK